MSDRESFKKYFIYFLGGEGQKERERESQANFALSTESHRGLDSHDPEIQNQEQKFNRLQHPGDPSVREP